MIWLRLGWLFQTGFVSHIDAATEIDQSFRDIASSMNDRGIPMSDLEARMVGGNLGFSEDITYKIRKLSKQYAIPILEEDILLTRGEVIRDHMSCVTMDLATGIIYDYDDEQICRVNDDREQTLRFLERLKSGETWNDAKKPLKLVDYATKSECDPVPEKEK